MSEKIWEAFGKWLQLEREKSGVSQKQVADKAGIHVVQLSRIENGRSGAKRDTVVLISEAINELSPTYKIDLDEALRRAGFSSSQKKVSSIPELLEALEAAGIVDMSFFGSLERISEYSEDEFEELKERIIADVGITLKRKRGR